VTALESWTCPTCGRTVPTPFCAQCGERPRDPRDLTLLGLGLALVHTLTSVDGKALSTLRRLFTRPGELSAAYVRGQRVGVIAPFPLFLLANVAFFGLASLTHAGIFSATLESHLTHQDWSEFAQRLVARRLEALHTTLPEYAPLFDRAGALHAKSLWILMVLPFTLLVWLVFRRGGKPFVAHWVFTLHLFAFLLLLFCVWLAIVGLDELRGGAGLDSARMDNVLTVANLGASAAYLFLAVGTFYGARGRARVLEALGLSLAIGVLPIAYRFLVFVITLYTT